MNALYDKAREEFLNGDLSWRDDTFKAILVDTALHTATPAATDPVLSDIAAGARVAVSGVLSGKTSTGGVADASDIIFPSVSGATVEAIILYKDTGIEATSRLIAFIDDGTGLVLAPNTGDVLLAWSNGAAKIFKL